MTRAVALSLLSLLLLLTALGSALAQDATPPVMPALQEVQLPPTVELAPPATLAADLPKGPLTAADAVTLALRHQPSLTVTRAYLTGAQARTRQADAARGTTLGVGGALTGTEVSGGGSASAAPDYQVSATARKLLYDSRHTRDLVHQSQAQERVADATLTTAQANLAAQVKQAFYAYLQAVRLVQVSENNVTNQKQHVALAEARLKGGLGLPYDLVRAQTAYSEAIYGLTAARNTAARARVALAQLLGIDPRTPLEPAQTGEPALNLGLPEAVQQAVAKRPEMLAAQAGLDAARLALSAARTTNAPAVVGSVGVQQRGDSLLPDTNVLTAAVTVTWNAFDAGYTQGKVREAESNVTAAEATIESTRLQVTAEVSGAYLDLRTAEQKLVTAAAQVGNAQEALRLAEGRYRAGVGVFIDVLDAQNALDVANTNVVNAATAVDLARVAYARASSAGQ